MTPFLPSHPTEAGPLAAILRNRTPPFKDNFYYIYGTDHNVVGQVSMMIWE